MADRVSVSIRIGGDLDTGLAADFLAAIDADDARQDWEGEPFTFEAPRSSPHLILVAHEVAWGRFEAIEQFCLAHHLPFIRWSVGSGRNFGPEPVVHDGRTTPRRFVASEDDEILLDEAMAEELGSTEAIRDYFAAASPVLPPFRLINLS